MKTSDKTYQTSLSPEDVINLLKKGNENFTAGIGTERDYLEQISKTSEGQFPFAVVLSCIDSRVPVETIFDLGIGDIFSARVAGNIVNGDILGSIEYGCKVAGSKAIVVLGHTKCGAVTAACKNVELGNITGLLSNIKPAVNNVGDPNQIEAVTVENVKLSIEQIRKESPILHEMEQNNEIKIVGAIYHVENGQVDFI